MHSSVKWKYRRTHTLTNCSFLKHKQTHHKQEKSEKERERKGKKERERDEIKEIRKVEQSKVRRALEKTDNLFHLFKG